MKIYRLTAIAILCSLLQSCNAPIVNKALGAPASIINKVAGPIIGPLLGR